MFSSLRQNVLHYIMLDVIVLQFSEDKEFIYMFYTIVVFKKKYLYFNKS